MPEATPEEALTDCEVFRDRGTLNVLVGSTTVVFKRVVNLRLAREEVLYTETGTLEVELDFRVTIGVWLTAPGVELATPVGT